MMLMTSFLSLFIVGAVHLSMFAITRYMVNYAAFAAARTVMVRASNPEPVDIPLLGELSIDIPLDWRLQVGWPAAAQVLSALKWREGWQGLPGFIEGGQRVSPDGSMSDDRDWLWVTYKVPFGMPIVNDLPEGGLPVRGYARYVVQDVAEGGDNAR
jgi:hypothetical protein